MSEIRQYMDCEVLVVGGGPAGSVAAVAAARQGARTILVERQGFLGGNLTAGGIDTIYGLYTPGTEPMKVVGGIPDEVVDRLRLLDACYERPNTYGSGIGITFSAEHLKLVLEELLIESNVKILYHALVPDVLRDGDRVTGVVMAAKQGLQKLTARTVIDTTGDADIVAFAGGEYEKAGDKVSGQSLTTVFFMANVDVEKAKAFGRKALWAEMERANEQGTYRLPRIEGSFHATPFSGMIEANMTRIPNVDATDLLALSMAETAGRKQVQEYVRFLKDRVPGFGDAFLVKTGCHIGVRETRRMIGEYVLTKDDVLEGRKFDDAIARCGMPIEDHHSGRDTRWVYIKDYGYYDIPFRCMVPTTLSNVFVAGRCISASHDAHASVRSAGTAMAMGQAAGIAAAMVSREGGGRVNIGMLQARLREWGAVI